MANGGDQRPPNNKESWEFKGNATFTPRRRRPYEGRNPTILPQKGSNEALFQGGGGIGGVGTVRFPKLMGCFFGSMFKIPNEIPPLGKREKKQDPIFGNSKGLFQKIC